MGSKTYTKNLGTKYSPLLNNTEKQVTPTNEIYSIEGENRRKQKIISCFTVWSKSEHSMPDLIKCSFQYDLTLFQWACK